MSQRCSRVIYSFFGPPGSGKGTLAEMCARDLGFKVLSTGNLCRKHVSLGTEFGKMLDEYLSTGRLIPDELVTEMVRDWLENAMKKGESVILDGYPRTRRQAELFAHVLEKDYPSICFKVVSFEISDEEIMRRLTSGRRVVCSNTDCQAVYSDAVPPGRKGICNYCGSKLSKREDDSTELVRERLKYYPEYKNGLFSYYESVKMPIERLFVERLSPQQVFDKFLKMGQNNTIRELSR